MSNENLRAPSLALLALEFRAPFEFGSLLPAWPALQRAPSGDGHTVLVVSQPLPTLSLKDRVRLAVTGKKKPNASVVRHVAQRSV